MTEKMITIATRKCIYCGKTGEVTVPEAGLRRYQKGEHIQFAMPSVPAGDREQLLTGMHSDCFDTVFADEEDE